MQNSLEFLPVRVLTPSVPGGPARQYRVQVVDQVERTWRLFAAFGRREPAQSCLQDLLARGISSRLVAVRICPTSA